jgi:2-keto-3-deoxy-6-phosphogluconate aldolase
MEITFNQANPESFQSTRRSIEVVNKKFSGRVFCGAGTVTRQKSLKLQKQGISGKLQYGGTMMVPLRSGN